MFTEMSCKTFCTNLTRRRTESTFSAESQFIRCLKTLDLASIGIGSVVGAGLYVVTGQLARDVAGPAVVISFAIAALSSLLSGICYAEFGCRIPKAGSAYVYTYVALGEVWAFIVGWNIILEYIIAEASLARACSENINALSGGAIYNFFMKDIGQWNSPFLAKFPDLLALLIVVFVSVMVSLGVKQVSTFIKIVTFINLSVVVFVIAVGLFYVDPNNWSTVEKFAPYGVEGIVAAAGSCFYAFVGFDVIGTAGEEAINPKKSIPTSLMITIIVSFAAYFGVSTILTLMVPANELNIFAPLAEAFAQRGFPAAKYIISVGAIFATTGTLSSMAFAGPRVISAMAADGLLFKWFAHINDKTHVPVRAVVACGIIVSILAVILELKQLVEMLSIGTLIAYTMVAIAVLLTRYQRGIKSVHIEEDEQPVEDNRTDSSYSWWKRILRRGKEDESTHYERLQNVDKVEDDKDKQDDNTAELQHKKPTEQTSFHASVAAFVLTVGIIIFCIMITLGHKALVALNPWVIFSACLNCLIIAVTFLYLRKQPKNDATFPFTVPLVPFLPVLTIFVNVVLLVSLSFWTYVRFGVWMSLGFMIYAFYGYKHSSEARTEENHEQLILSEPPGIHKSE